MYYFLWLLSKLSESPFSNRRFASRAGWVDDIGEWLRDVIGSLWDSISQLASDAMDWFVELIQPALDAIKEIFTEFSEWISDLVQPIIDWFSATYEAIVTWFSDAITAALEWFGGILTAAYDWVYTLTKTALQWWLDFCMGFWEWLIDMLQALFEAGVELLKDASINLLSNGADFIAYAIESIPVPDFVQQNAIGTLMGQAGPVVGWVASTLMLPEALTMIAAAFAFRMLRKVLTLFQW